MYGIGSDQTVPYIYKMEFQLSDGTSQIVQNTSPGFIPPASPQVFTQTTPAGKEVYGFMTLSKTMSSFGYAAGYFPNYRTIDCT